MKADLLDYHASITHELENVKDRIRNLIGSKHWLTDGEHKEAVLRRVLRNHIPETIRIGTGFVYFADNSCSTQQDILLTDKSKPTLFKDEELVIVTPEAVKGVIEVKTRIDSPTKLRDIITKLSNSIAQVRRSLNDQWYTAGLFVYEKQPFSRKIILQALQQAANGDPNRAIDFLAFGPNTYIRYYYERVEWCAYRLENLGQSYFISNIVWRMVDNNPRSMRYAWFPLKSDEKQYGVYRISLRGGDVEPYNILE
jgi:hypothetical protein